MKKLLLVLICVLSLNSAFSQAKDTFNVTFRVTLKGSGRKINADGLRVTGALNSKQQNNWDPGSAVKLSLIGPASDSIYGVTLRVARDVNQRTDPGTSIDLIPYKFINGNNWGNGSTDPTEDERGLSGLPCAQSGGSNRIFETTSAKNGDNIILPAYVFNSCKVTFATGTNDLKTVNGLSISPNPVSDIATLSFANVSNDFHTLSLLNAIGQVVRVYAPTKSEQITIETANLTKGIYFARLSNEQGEATTLKFVAE